MDFTKTIYRVSLFLFLFLVIQNLFTVFFPEVGFDALWYHLTLPKLWLFKHQWYFPGGLLYYSAMPRLTETIFIPLIGLAGYAGPKLLQFLSGLGSAYLIYKICRKLSLEKTLSLVAVNLFYITWLVSWQSGSAYIDLFRTFLETAALYFFLEKRNCTGSVLLGLAIGTKWLSLGSLVLYSLIFGCSIIPVALLVSLPWFLIAYYYTGNVIYPIFSPIISHTSINLLQAIQKVLLLPVTITFPFDDFISPVAGLLVSLSAIQIIFSNTDKIRKISLLAVCGAILSVIINPPSSRFFLPFLPAASIASIYLVSLLNVRLRSVLMVIFLTSFVLVIGLRTIAFAKFIPLILHQQSSKQYLVSQSAKLKGTFIDSDDYIQNNLPANKKYLIDKLHNLYYFPYNYDHTSWSNSSTEYDYLITTDQDPQKVNGKLIHTNNLGIQVFKLR